VNPSELCYGCMEIKSSQNKCTNCGYQEGSGPESSHHLPPGTILANKYLVGKVLGQGGFGITYIAYDLILELKLAIKEFFPMGLVARGRGNIEVDTYVGEQQAQYAFGLDRFLYEARTLARFSEHPNIVTVKDFFPDNGTAYMVMNYIEGKTLEDYLNDVGGKISFSKMLEIMMPVMDALREVHQVGIMHRDISPDNIFIRNDGRVSLIDFGAARQELLNKSQSLSVILKVGYSPEEQYRSRGEQGPWTDIYSVAATMYRGITGEVPPESMDRLAEDTLIAPSQLGIEIGIKQEQALLKALAVRTKERYRTVAEMQKALTNNINGPFMKQVNLEANVNKESIDGQPEQAFTDHLVIKVTPKESVSNLKEDESKQTIGTKHGLNTKVKVAIFSACVLIAIAVFILVDADVIKERMIVYSIGGAGIQIGAEVNDDLYIVSPKTNLTVGEDFYVSFDNNASFESASITMKVENSESGEILEEVEYNVDPEWTIIVTEQLYFPDPGKFKVSFIVNEEVRATQEVIVE
jgi:serine/threonine protein kinase